MKKLFTFLILTTALLFSFKAFSVPKLNSLPGAEATIFLDFDGHYVQSSLWNGGDAFYCAASGMDDSQITEAFNRVAEDYRPFEINITTDSSVFESVPLNRRIRIIITTTSAWYPGVGGVAWIGSFNWGDDTPAFVFSDRLGPYSPKMVGECCSHESGHTVGLSHQSKYGTDCNTPVETYNSGIGSGQTGWAPIMGNSYNKNMSNWNNGPTPYGCTTIQDNLSIITNQNAIVYRADDYADTLNTGTYTLPNLNFNIAGVISNNADKDAFKFTLLQGSNVYLTAVPFNVGDNYIGANLDVKIELYSSPTDLIGTYDPVTMSVTIDTFLNAGTYYIKIDGTGNTNIGEYGSLGSYTLNGVTGALAIHAVNLVGKTDNNKHNLSWHITADEAIKKIEIEISDDGINFTGLTTASPVTNKFSYQPYKTNMVYYRLKVTSVIDQTGYSNIIGLKTTGNSGKLFNVSTLIKNELLINAAENYQYQIIDASGKTIAAGNGIKGINRINVSNQPAGMYIVQLFNNSQRQTERIIKL
ncbi:T9SS type A sorting domain-containing protein [Ferruginibacter sp.]